MESVKLSKNAVNKAALVINHGGVIIFPTDTVYGLIADATNKKAVEKIFKIKKRPRSKPLAVFVSNIKQAKEIAEISKKQETILRKRWPGKYTFILKFKNFKLNSNFKFQISNLAIGKDETIALRIPNHKFLLALLKKVDRPLAQTSVNVSCQPELTKISDIEKQFSKFDILIVDAGNLPKSDSSTIIDLSKNKIKTLRK